MLALDWKYRKPKSTALASSGRSGFDLVSVEVFDVLALAQPVSKLVAAAAVGRHNAWARTVRRFM